jgi:hypothetical protein
MSAPSPLATTSSTTADSVAAAVSAIDLNGTKTEEDGQTKAKV